MNTIINFTNTCILLIFVSIVLIIYTLYRYKKEPNTKISNTFLAIAVICIVYGTYTLYSNSIDLQNIQKTRTLSHEHISKLF